MDFFSLIGQIDAFLSWKLLIPGSLISFSFWGLACLPLFHDILHDMFNYFVVSSIFFALLVVCKIGFQLQELISWKRTLEREENNNIRAFIHLSRRETALLKYLFLRPSKFAWLPPESSDALLLLHKGYIEIIAEKRKFVDPLNFYTSEKDALYKLTDKTIDLISRHKETIMLTWKKVRIDKTLNKYQ